MNRSTFRCSCGGSASATSVPASYAVDIIDTWRAVHLELGHHEVDAAELARIRARQRREEDRALKEAR